MGQQLLLFPQQSALTQRTQRSLQARNVGVGGVTAGGCDNAVIYPLKLIEKERKLIKTGTWLTRGSSFSHPVLQPSVSHFTPLRQATSPALGVHGILKIYDPVDPF